MAKQQEIVAQLGEVNATLSKIGAETDALLKKITDLEAALANQPDASQELVDAVAAVKAAAQAVDEKVPDAPPPAP